MEGNIMGQEITTYSQVLTHSINVSFTCEHCGEHNSFTQEIVGSGKKSKYSGAFDAKGANTLTKNDYTKILTKAQKDLDRGIENAKHRLAKEKFSWLYANKCSKCKHYQSWQTRQIWRNFFKTFFGGPFMLFLLVMIPLSIVFGRDTSSYPEWISIVLGVLTLIIMIVAVVNLISSLIHRDRKQRNKPTVTI
jgi:hypothetical protein